MILWRGLLVHVCTITLCGTTNQYDDFMSRVRRADWIGDRNEKRVSGQLLNSFQGFNYSMLDKDPHYIEFLTSQIPVHLKSGQKTSKRHQAAIRATARKFFQINQMIMYFQQTPVFGKFGYYGCWCFPDGAKDLQSGFGEPVDDIDRTCKRLSQCYRCSMMKHGRDLCPVTTEYVFQGLEDEVTGRRYVNCLDEDSSCSRSLCECDKQLAYKIAHLEKEWEEDYHQKWGTFNREQTCRQGSSFIWGNQRSYGGGRNSNSQPDACCGFKGERFPYFTDKGKRSCCGGKTFNSELMKCCPNYELKSVSLPCVE